MGESDGSPRTLVLMRHAHAAQTGRTDFERSLTDVGVQEASAQGEWLRRAGVVADAALVSAAARAVATWHAVAQSAGWQVDPTEDRGLYTADPDTALDLVRETPDDVSGLVVVAHNPTIATVVQLLDDGEGDPDAVIRLMRGYPAGALTVMEYAGSWAALDWSGARVVAFNAPD